jgi:methylated-DNA-protein-cysteine methyltransferase related protein
MKKGGSEMQRKNTYEAIYRIIRGIPRGKVATYGQIAKLAETAGQARQVGYALHALPAKSTVPWHRVINAKGEISLRATAESMQKTLLEKEGVMFDANNRISLKQHGWLPTDNQRTSK